MPNSKVTSLIATATITIAMSLSSSLLSMSTTSHHNNMFADALILTPPLISSTITSIHSARANTAFVTTSSWGRGSSGTSSTNRRHQHYINNNNEHPFRRRYSQRDYHNDHSTINSSSSSLSSNTINSSNSNNVNSNINSNSHHGGPPSSSLHSSASSPTDNGFIQQNPNQFHDNNGYQQQQQQQQHTLQHNGQSLETNNNNNNNNNIQAHSSFEENPSSSSESESISISTPIDSFTLPVDAAPTLDARLLCASQCAYSITQPYFKSSAFRPATTAKRLTKGVNSVIIGHTYDGIYIAFRGTQSSSPIDWLQNAALFLSNVGDSSKNEKNRIKGRVHTGFYRGTKSLWKPLKNIIKDMVDESRKNGWRDNVYLTGHSKGGAMATVAAVLMKRDGDLPDPTYVCTFASAKVGDSEFRNEYNKNINQTSYEAHLDLIPFLPPSSTSMEMMDTQMTDMLDTMLWSDTSIHQKENYKWDYQTVGTRKYINENYEIIDDVTRELDEQRIKEIEKFSFLSIDEFKAAHCSSCPGDDCTGYYFNAIAGGVCEDEECIPPIGLKSDVGENSSVVVNNEIQNVRSEAN